MNAMRSPFGDHFVKSGPTRHLMSATHSLTQVPQLGP
jgi:hypothetical protein